LHDMDNHVGVGIGKGTDLIAIILRYPNLGEHADLVLPVEHQSALEIHGSRRSTQACLHGNADVPCSAMDPHRIFMPVIEEGITSCRQIAIADLEGERDVSVDSRTKR